MAATSSKQRSTRVRRRSSSTAAAPSVAVIQPRGGVAATALTASASRASQTPAANQNVRVPQWQLDSLAYYDQIGAVRYGAQFWARGLSKIRFFAAEKDDKGEVKETNDPDAIEAFERVQDPMGGRVQIASTYGQLRYLVGECYLTWTPETVEDPETWEVVSILELRKLSRRGGRETWHRISAPGLTPQELVEAADDDFEPMGNEVIVYRLWRRHPGYSQMADAPMRSVLSDCEEIVRCTHTINARLISRLSGPGLFAIPMSWKVKPLADAVGEENPEEDPFQTRLTQAMLAAIGTPGSAESVAPIVVRVPDETVEKAHLYKIWDPSEVIREVELRKDAIHRYAQGVDMPAGKVEGIEDSTHWNAWAIDKDGLEHLLPVAGEFANDIASAYLRPTLRKNYERDDWAKFVVGYDPAGAVTNPDEFADVMQMYDRRVISKAYLRGVGNATDDDAMPDEEIAESLFASTHQVVEVSGGKLVESAAPAVAADEPPTGEDTTPDMPVEPTQEEVQATSNGGLTSLDYQTLGLAEATLEEIRDRIGLRLRNHLAGGKCAECVAAVKETPAPIIAAELGEELISEQGVDLHELAQNAGSNFAGLLERRGVSPTQARALQEILERHAVNTIYEYAPNLPAGFIGRVRALEAA